jgi:hypothetical protein
MIHIAYVRPVDINSVGTVVDRNSKSTTLFSLTDTEKQMRVIPGSLSPNAHDYPTIETYLVRENSGGFILNHMDNNMIVTYSS